MYPRGIKNESDFLLPSEIPGIGDLPFSSTKERALPKGCRNTHPEGLRTQERPAVEAQRLNVGYFKRGSLRLNPRAANAGCKVKVLWCENMRQGSLPFSRALAAAKHSKGARRALWRLIAMTVGAGLINEPKALP